ncbi:MAG: cytochrome c oxidase subunit II [Clostridia bacterium]|nr:cytochrome c oxidase subunit II [Clostridia bacterium]
MGPRSLRAVLAAALWVVFTALAEVGVEALIAHFPVVASSQGELIDETFALLLRLTAPVFAFVVTVLVVSVLGAAQARREAASGPARYPRDNRYFSWTWFVVSLALNVYFVFGPGVTDVEAIVLGHDRPASGDLVVEAQAHQWGWDFAYPELGITSKTLVLPAGREIHFVVTSKDVIHSFWVPAFRVKMDAIPGRENHLTVTTTRVISTNDDMTARVQCAELCGLGHPNMRAGLEVLPPDQFQAWVEKTKSEETTTSGGR